MASATPKEPLTHTRLLGSILRGFESHCADTAILKHVGECRALVSQLEANAAKCGVLARFNLSGQVALVTGGGQGIGRAFAHALGEAGAKVAVADIMPSRAESVVAELNAKGIECIAIHVDVSDKEQVDRMIQKILDTWGDLHVACNNAGIVIPSDSEVAPESDWIRTKGVNLDGVFYCCQAEARHMLQKKYGRIINTASICAHVSVRPQNQTAYNVSKAGVRHMTKTLGAEWATRGVRVNSISPGYIETPLIASPDLDPLKLKWINDTPVGRLGQVGDLVGAMLYLASPSSDFMTGADLLVDGGLTCW